jgi:hypothetical protein
MTPDLFAWADAGARLAAARVDHFGVRRVCDCGLFWLLHQPHLLLGRFTLVKCKGAANAA